MELSEEEVDFVTDLEEELYQTINRLTNSYAKGSFVSPAVMYAAASKITRQHSEIMKEVLEVEGDSLTEECDTVLQAFIDSIRRS